PLKKKAHRRLESATRTEETQPTQAGGVGATREPTARRRRCSTTFPKTLNGTRASQFVFVGGLATLSDTLESSVKALCSGLDVSRISLRRGIVQMGVGITALVGCAMIQGLDKYENVDDLGLIEAGPKVGTSSGNGPAPPPPGNVACTNTASDPN